MLMTTPNSKVPYLIFCIDSLISFLIAYLVRLSNDFSSEMMKIIDKNILGSQMIFKLLIIAYSLLAARLRKT